MSSVIAVSVVPNNLIICCAVIRTRSSPSAAIGRDIVAFRTQRDDLTGGIKTWRALFYNLQIKSSLPRKKLTHSSKEEALASLLYQNKDKKKPLLFALFHPVLLQSS
jgi:hypothetical protein